MHMGIANAVPAAHMLAATTPRHYENQGKWPRSRALPAVTPGNSDVTSAVRDVSNLFQPFHLKRQIET